MIDLKLLEKKLDISLSNEISESLSQWLNEKRNMMEELKEEFLGKGEVKGYSFKQIKRSDKGYIYAVTCIYSNHTHYEVFTRRENHRYDNITYPKAIAFGRYAWTYMTLDAAEKRFNTF